LDYFNILNEKGNTNKMTNKYDSKKNNLVSIIIPMYNAENIIKETLQSVQNQTYKNWEAIIIDDCSIDKSFEYVTNYSKTDPRIKIFKMEKNSGPGAATKFGFKKSKGELIAFLDSDDLWVENKLEEQINFMKKNNYAFICTDYEQINEKSEPLGRYIRCKKKANYLDVLYTNPIGSSTVMITRELLNKIDIPIIRKDNDYSLWLKLLKIYPYVYGIRECYMKYRVWKKSISYNRFGSIKYHWIVYKDYENFSSIKAIYLIINWGFIKLLKIK